MVDGTPVEFSIPKNIIVEIYKVVGNYRRQWPDLPKRNIPRPSSRKAESGDACIYAVVMRSRSSTTPHLPSYFLPITSIQLFHHQSYGHTFPVPYEPFKSKVHQVPSHPAMICSIELSHYQIIFLSCMSSCYDDLLILILPPILFRHFQKFSKLLYSLSLHLPWIKNFSIGL